VLGMQDEVKVDELRLFGEPRTEELYRTYSAAYTVITRLADA
jgi:hypothetical protein